MTELVRLRDQLAKLDSPFHGIMTEEDSIAVKQAIALIEQLITDSNTASAEVIEVANIMPKKRMAAGTKLYQYPHSHAVLHAAVPGGSFYMPLRVLRPGVLELDHVMPPKWGVPKRDQRQLAALAFDELLVFPLSPKENYQAGWLECFNTNFYPEDVK